MSVWDDIAESKEEAENLKVRAALMRVIRDRVIDKGWTQTTAAEHLGITQPRVSDLFRGKIHKFSLDALVSMGSKVGVSLSLNVEAERPSVEADRPSAADNPVFGGRSPADVLREMAADCMADRSVSDEDVVREVAEIRRAAANEDIIRRTCLSIPTDAERDVVFSSSPVPIRFAPGFSVDMDGSMRPMSAVDEAEVGVEGGTIGRPLGAP